jgi:hypothetical protein
MVRRFASLTGGLALVCGLSFAAVPAHSVPLTALKADSVLTLVKKEGDGHGNKNWNKNGNNKNWNKNGNNNYKGKNHWSGHGRYNKHWNKYGKWHGGDHYRGGYWRNGIFVTLPFIVGDQCYDYLDWRDGAPRPGWYWVC